jgi:hypothetical protein
VVSLSVETGLAPEIVVERLIDFELLAAEARRRGHDSGRALRMAVRKAMVQRFLEEDLEGTHRPEDMSDEELRASYEANKGLFVRPRAVKVAHILVKADSRGSTREERAEAGRIARRIYREAAKASDLNDFLEIGERHVGKAPREVLVERISNVVVKGANLDRQFLDASLELQDIGDVSEPFESAFGTHIVFLEDERPAVNRSFEEVREEVREREHPYLLKQAFQELSEELRLSTEVAGWSGELRRGLDL